MKPLSQWLGGVILVMALLMWGQPSQAEDKSGSRSGLVKLPSAGGTVHGESSAFKVNSNTGASHFSLPLPVLPGRAGVVPDVSLVYSQFTGDQGFGQGWRLSVPSIEISRELGIPVSGVLPNGDFRRVLRFMGKDLVFVGKRRGVAQFELESGEQALRIRYHSQAYRVDFAKRIEGEQPGIVQGFEVIYPDGRRQLFSGDLRQAEGATGRETRFPLTYTVAPHGESVRYRYTQHGGQSYLTDVWFAGGVSHYQFELMTNAFPRLRYDNGLLQTAAKRYSKMVARVSGVVHAQYCFAYRGRASGVGVQQVVRTHPDCQAEAEARLGAGLANTKLTVQEQLMAVFRYGNDARLTERSLRLPTVHFDYSAWDASRLADRDVVYPLPTLTESTQFRPEDFELADLNHDGLVDVVRLNSDGTSSRFLALGEQQTLFGEAEHWAVQRGPRSVSPNLRSDHFHFADLNGDTYLDLLEFYDGEAVVYPGQQGGSFDEGKGTRLSVDNSLGLKHFKDGKARWVDFNQDGRTDVLTTDASAGEGRVLTLYLNLSYQKANSEWVYYFVPHRYQSPYPASAFELSDVNVRLRDVNGDQLPDLLHFRPSGAANQSGVCVYYNRGDLYSLTEADALLGDSQFDGAGRCGVGGHFIALRGLGGVSTLNHLWLADVNGDGIQDYALPGNDQRQLWVWLGLGNGEIVPTPMTLPLNLPLSLNLDDGSRSRIVDIDGDSQDEILVFDDQAPSARRVVMLDFNRDGDQQLIRSNLLTHVEFDSGLRHDILYATSTDERVRDQKLGRAVNPLHFPVVLAKQLISSYGVPGQQRNNVQVEEFFYHAPFFNPREKQFNGFGEVSTLVYGDDYAGQSHLQVRRYHTQGDDPGSQALAGSLKEEHIYTVKADAEYERITQKNTYFDPALAGVHSLSTATRQQTLPKGDILLQSRFIHWAAAERSRQLSFFVRKTAETQHLFNGKTAMGEARTQTQFDEFDEYNIPWLIKEYLDAVPGPFGITVPASLTVQAFDYATSRDLLAERGIVSAPANILVTRNDAFLNYLEWDYHTTGQVASELRVVESSLNRVPDSIAAHFVPFAEYYREFSYDEFGNPVGVIDDLGERESAVYDARGVFPESYSTAPVNGQQQTWRMTYAAGRLQTLITPLGVTAETSYDSLGRKRVLRESSGGEIRYTYRQGLAGQPSYIKRQQRRYASAQATPDGEQTFIEQLSAYRADGTPLAQVEDADLADGQVGIRIRSYGAFNRNKQKIFQWTPYTVSGKTVAGVFNEPNLPEPDTVVGTVYRYDALGRLSAVVVPSGKSEATAYFGWGKKTTTRYWSNNRAITREVYRVSNRLGLYASVESNGAGVAHITRFERDERGYLSAIQLPGDEVMRTLVHDSAGRLEYQVVPGLGEQYKVYDARDRALATARIAADGVMAHSVEHSFDGLDRVLTTHLDGDLYATYRYDTYSADFKTDVAYAPAVLQPLGLLTEVHTRDPQGLFDTREKLGYDVRGQVIHREIAIADKVLGESFAYTLDGTLNKATNPLGLEGLYRLGRDQNLRAVSIRLPGEAAIQSVIEQVAYNSRGQMQHIRYRDTGQHHAQTNLTYDPATLQLTGIHSYYANTHSESRLLQDLHIELDQNNSITGIVDRAGPSDYGQVSRSGQFEYNWKDELIAATRYGKQVYYDYSAAGNFTRNTLLAEGELAQSTVNAMLPQGKQQGDYVFDGLGQLTKSPDIEAAQYDALGQLILLVTREHIVRFGYHATGTRVYKQVESREQGMLGHTQVALYPMESVAFEAGGAQSYVFVGESRLVRLEHATGEWFYYLKDHIGSSDIVMNSRGLPVEQMLYHAYGSEVSASVLSAQWQQFREKHAESLPKERTHHRFTGQYLDDASGLYHYGKRYYDPKLGRFISPDPLYFNNPQACLDSPRECNLYLYAFNNPMKYIDPTGEAGVEANKDDDDDTLSSGTTTIDGVEADSSSVPLSQAPELITQKSTEGSMLGHFLDNPALYLPSIPQEAIDFSAGLGDAILFGFGDDIRAWADIDGGVNRDSRMYGFGEISSIAAGGVGVFRGIYVGSFKLASMSRNMTVLNAASVVRNTLKRYTGPALVNAAERVKIVPFAIHVKNKGFDAARAGLGRTRSTYNYLIGLSPGMGGILND